LIETAGERRWFQTYKSPITIDGEMIGVVGFARDISDWKRTEAELITARAAAEKANNAKSRFLAAASHDLRQPLTALSLFVGVLAQKDPPGCGELVANIQACADNLSELLTDLLDVSKLDAGVVVPRPSDFSIDDLLAAVVSIHSSDAGLKGLRLRVRSAAAVIRTDQQLLLRIVGNLVANAVRYTRKGGVLIACRRRQGKRWIEVWDTGIGIAADQTGIIFEEFRQLGDAAGGRGSGLGLAIVAKTAALLGLEIRLRSRPGRGSMFAVELPAEHSNPPVPALPAEDGARYLRIGLVDDNAMLLQAMVAALGAIGHEVVAASDGARFFERLAGRAPDIVISDYRLGADENGFDVIAAARKAFGDTLPALVITGDTDPAVIRAMAGRGIAVLYKPIQIEALQAAILQATAPVAR
jgi:signal transduction histidine kinase